MNRVPNLTPEQLVVLYRHLEDTLLCPIGYAAMEDPELPSTLSCGHTFGYVTILQALEHNPKCPIGREPLKENVLIENQLIKDLTAQKAVIVFLSFKGKTPPGLTKEQHRENLLSKLIELKLDKRSALVEKFFELIQCPLSGEPLKIPVLAPCGHTFDASCFSGLGEDEMRTCPLDGSVVASSAIVPNRMALDVLEILGNESFKNPKLKISKELNGVFLFLEPDDTVEKVKQIASVLGLWRDGLMLYSDSMSPILSEIQSAKDPKTEFTILRIESTYKPFIENLANNLTDLCNLLKENECNKELILQIINKLHKNANKIEDLREAVSLELTIIEALAKLFKKFKDKKKHYLLDQLSHHQPGFPDFSLFLRQVFALSKIYESLDKKFSKSKKLPIDLLSKQELSNKPFEFIDKIQNNNDKSGVIECIVSCCLKLEKSSKAMQAFASIKYAMDVAQKDPYAYAFARHLREITKAVIEMKEVFDPNNNYGAKDAIFALHRCAETVNRNYSSQLFLELADAFLILGDKDLAAQTATEIPNRTIRLIAEEWVKLEGPSDKILELIGEISNDLDKSTIIEWFVNKCIKEESFELLDWALQAAKKTPHRRKDLLHKIVLEVKDLNDQLKKPERAATILNDLIIFAELFQPHYILSRTSIISDCCSWGDFPMVELAIELSQRELDSDELTEQLQTIVKRVPKIRKVKRKYPERAATLLKNSAAIAKTLEKDQSSQVLIQIVDAALILGNEDLALDMIAEIPDPVIRQIAQELMEQKLSHKVFELIEKISNDTTQAAIIKWLVKKCVREKNFASIRWALELATKERDSFNLEDHLEKIIEKVLKLNKKQNQPGTTIMILDAVAEASKKRNNPCWIETSSMLKKLIKAFLILGERERALDLATRIPATDRNTRSKVKVLKMLPEAEELFQREQSTYLFSSCAIS